MSLNNNLDLLHLQHVRTGIQSDLLLHKGSLSRVLGCEYVIQLFQCSALGLWGKKVNGGALEEVPDSKNDVRFPSDVLEGKTSA